MEQLLNSKIVCRTEYETRQFGERIAHSLPANASIGLLGPLGSGKTVFVKGLARGFGITKTVNSPSFNIVHAYSGKINLIHVDAYRLSGHAREADGLLLEDFLVAPYCFVVEWPERLFHFLKICDFIIDFTINADRTRTMTLKNNTSYKRTQLKSSSP